ncbi:MAG: undecaprenyl-diphosphate phosphatase [Halioglobus sp.]|nr:undecaprenyl-diphosphate phosphatase [Halioglobus sp.]
MDTTQAIVLAVVQGLTEFLPISSSAHLIIPRLLLGWPDQGLAFDVAVHVGTLSAVLMYYREDVTRMARHWLASLAGSPQTEDSRTVWYIVVATMPAGLVGLLGGAFIEAHLRSLPVVAATTLVFGILLGVADRRAGINPGGRELGWRVACIIGCAQALAPIPGVSRSGITMTAALLLGMSRQASARFSFLLSIPIIASAGLLQVLELGKTTHAVDWSQLALGVAVSGIMAYLCIAAFLRLLEKVGLMPFVYYRIALAGLLYFIWLA